MNKYYYERHGLLYIVYQDDESKPSTSEDSRWEDEEKAREHCRILNEAIEIKHNGFDMYSCFECTWKGSKEDLIRGQIIWKCPKCGGDVYQSRYAH